MFERRGRGVLAVAVWGVLGWTSQAAGATFTVNMASPNRFDPAVVMIQPGDTVTWVNVDSMTHNSLSGDPGDPSPGSIWSSGTLSNGQSFSFTFTSSAQTTDYYCSLHATQMFGRVIVGGTGVQGTMIPVNTNVTSSLSLDWYAMNFTAARVTGRLNILVTNPSSVTTTVFSVAGTLGPQSWVSIPFTYSFPTGQPGNYTVTLELRTLGGALIASDTDVYTRF